MKKDLLSISDISAEEFERIMDLALKIKQDIRAYGSVFEGRTAALIFDKPSLRTRVTFEVAMNQFGGKSLYIPGKDISLGKRESIADGARNLSRWVDAIIMRTFGHEIIKELAEYASIPVVNALTDLEHPCQALAHMLTLKETMHTLEGKRLVFIGDGNNVAHSLMLLAPLAGMDFTMCCPEGYEPDGNIESAAQQSAASCGTAYGLERDPVRAADGADVIYTDVWASMGQEDETEERSKIFSSYQVNAHLVSLAKPDCLVSHCLPAHRGEEITSEVLDGSRSIALDEAENRLHVQKAVLYKLMSS